MSIDTGKIINIPPPRNAITELSKSIRHVCWRIKFLLKSFPVLINYMLHNDDDFESKIAVAAIIKNEGAYIKEWIEYHKLVGVDKFYIYDNESVDDTATILRPYIKNGDVIYTYVKTTGKRKPQVEVYNDVIKKYRNKSKWIAFIDADEFIVPVTHKTIGEVIDYIERQVCKKRIVGLAAH
jgi:hypothetical protein